MDQSLAGWQDSNDSSYSGVEEHYNGIVGLLYTVVLTAIGNVKQLSADVLQPVGSDQAITSEHHTPIVQGDLYTYLQSTEFSRISTAWYFFGGLVGVFTLWSSIYMVEVLSSEAILDF